MADVSETKKLVKDLQSAADNEDIIALLNLLKGNVKATEPLLRETKAGLAVGKLRSHASKDVSELAKEIVKKWKTDVDQSKGKQVNGSATHNGTRPAVAKQNSAITPTSPITPKGFKPDLTARRTVKTDGVKIDSTGDKIRDKCVEMMYDSLASDSTAPNNQILSRAVAIEAHVFNEHGSQQSYRPKMRSLILNLKEKSNPALRGSVVSGELAVARLCTMTNQEMAPEERKRADQLIKEQNFHNALGADEQAAETSAFQCGRCKQWKTKYRQAQTRSADEPMTTFVTCVVCNNRWKFS